MPYIKQQARLEVNEDLYNNRPADPGELNFAITQLVYRYYKMHGGRYQQVNDVLGALEGAKLEFYRRVAAPYEDTKIKENGDVYE